MNRTWLLLVVLIIAIGGTYYLLQYNKKDQKTTMAGLDRQFAVRDTQIIGKIFLADRHGNQTRLRRSGKEWIVNDQFPARRDAISNLLRAVGNVEMKFKPPQAAEENMIQSLATEGIKVEVFDQQDRILKSYYVGGATNDETGTYMILEGYDQPYVTHIPGWTGNLRFRYNLVGDDWRDRSLFKLSVDDIKRVSVDYPKQKSKSFVIEKEGRDWQVSPLYPTTPRLGDAAQAGKAEQYLRAFRNIGTAGFRNLVETKDSLRTLTPFVDIQLETLDGKEMQAQFLPQFNQPAYDEKEEKFIYPTETVSNYLIFTENDDMLVAQHRQVENLFWAYDFFFID